MVFVEWNSEYNVAVKAFNDDHKELFSYINQLHDGLQAGFKIAEMSYILKGLLDYATKHFQKEEEMMLIYKYQGYEQQKTEHAKLLAEIEEFYTDFIAGKKAFSFALLEFLNNWIMNHILITDMQYKQFFTDIAQQKSK